MPSVWELHTFEFGLKESPNAVLHLSVHVYKPSSATGHVRVGWPRFVRYDRGMHDRDVLSSIFIQNGAMIRLAGLEIPEQSSIAGRRGDMSKKTMTKATMDTHVSGRELEDMILGECLPSYRAKTCKPFVRWGGDERRRRIASRKGCACDRISTSWRQVLYCRKPRAGKHEMRWELHIEIDRFREEQRQSQ